jgi:hypothetical protein
MDWEEFVHSGRAAEFHLRARSFSGFLLDIVQEVADHNTLSSWVRETNAKLIAK